MWDKGLNGFLCQHRDLTRLRRQYCPQSADWSAQLTRHSDQGNLLWCHPPFSLLLPWSQDMIPPDSVYLVVCLLTIVYRSVDRAISALKASNHRSSRVGNKDMLISVYWRAVTARLWIDVVFPCSLSSELSLQEEITVDQYSKLMIIKPCQSWDNI